MIALLLHLMVWTYITPENILSYTEATKSASLLCIPYQKDDVIYFWYFYNMDTMDEAIASINHPDLESVDNKKIEKIIKQNPHNIVYNFTVQGNLSVNLVYWLHTQKPLPAMVDPQIAFLYKSTYKTDYYQYIPITMLVSSCQELKDIIMESFKYHQLPHVYRCYDRIQHIFKQLDINGVCINKRIAKKYFKTDAVDSILYPKTQFYSLTGRPSTRLENINIGNLHKAGMDRKLITSRFGSDGYIMELDFDAYHIRLTALHIGYDFTDNESVHLHFAKQYFNKDIISEEQYEEAKKITFKHLYSADYNKLPVEYPFFSKLYDYLKEIEQFHAQNGYVESPYTNKKMYHIENATAGKLLSYINQSCETEINAQLIDKILNSLKDLNSKMILYMYDAFIFDIQGDELNAVLDRVYPILTSVAPVKIKLGTSFKDMTVINWENA